MFSRARKGSTVDREKLRVRSVWMQEPQFVLDAGGETAAALSGSLHRCIAEIAPNQILEVISPEPSSRTEIPEWCHITGNELLHVQTHKSETLFWIRKKSNTATDVMSSVAANAESV